MLIVWLADNIFPNFFFSVKKPIAVRYAFERFRQKQTKKKNKEKKQEKNKNQRKSIERTFR